MSFLSRVAGRLRAEPAFERREPTVGVKSAGSSASPSFGGIPPLSSLPSASTMLVSQSTAMTVSTVYACVAIRARDVARCTPSLYMLDDEGGTVTVTDHPVAKLFRRPNKWQTWFEFCQQMGSAYLLRGNAYAAILRDGRGRPVALIPINPDLVIVLEAIDGGIFYQVNRYGLWLSSVLNDFPMAIPSADVFHLRDLSFNTLVGVSRIGVARDAIGLAMAQEQQASRWAGNGARPTGILQSKKKLQPDTAARLKQNWDDFQSGIQNVGRTAVLEDGIEWKQLGLNSVDLQFLDQRNYSVQDIARFFNMPTRKLALPDMTRGSTIIQEEQDYVNTTVAPDLDMWEQKFVQVFDLDDEGLNVDMDEGRLLRADITTRFNAYRIGLLSGILKPNEARSAERLPKVAGGDEVYRPLNMAALGSDMSGQAADGAGRPAAGQLPADGVPTNDPLTNPADPDAVSTATTAAGRTKTWGEDCTAFLQATLRGDIEPT